ncbi:hypothetical protein ASF38_14480 [Aeromicrobium sp. Leaf272]|nr:hypothetical protein ASF38_14480 [Aeromicrobium sp. Leaf272]
MVTDRRLVVGAVIVDSLQSPTRVLAARRTSPPALAGLWEFPGGKVESGETPTQALLRELREELSIDVRVGGELEHPTLELWPASGGYSMRLFWAELGPGAKVHLTGSHDEFRWLTAQDLPSVAWLESDVAALPRVLAALA